MIIRFSSEEDRCSARAIKGILKKNFSQNKTQICDKILVTTSIMKQMYGSVTSTNFSIASFKSYPQRSEYSNSMDIHSVPFGKNKVWHLTVDLSALILQKSFLAIVIHHYNSIKVQFATDIGRHR